MHPLPTLPPCFLKIHSNFFFHLRLALPSGLFSLGFPTKILHAFLNSHACCIPRPTHPLRSALNWHENRWGIRHRKEFVCELESSYLSCLPIWRLIIWREWELGQHLERNWSILFYFISRTAAANTTGRDLESELDFVTVSFGKKFHLSQTIRNGGSRAKWGTRQSTGNSIKGKLI